MRAQRVRRLLLLMATSAGVAVTANLGLWQLDRAAQKKALQHALDTRANLPVVPQEQLANTGQEASAQHYRHVRLRGQWLGERTVYLDNRQMNGRPGYLVVTPLLLPGGAVLVQRGWAPRDPQQRARLPSLRTPGEEVELLGLIAPPPARLYEFADVESGPIRQNLEINAYAQEIGVAVRPLSVLQSGGPESATDGLLRQWPQPAVDIHKHYGYAFQWWALCALIAGLYGWFQVLEPRVRRAAR